MFSRTRDHSDLSDRYYLDDDTEGVHEVIRKEQYSSFSSLCGAMGSTQLNLSSPPPSVNYNYPSPPSVAPLTTPVPPVASPLSLSTSVLPTMELVLPSATPAPTSTRLIYGEVFVPMPSHGPRDRANWVERVRMGRRPVSDYLIPFEPELTLAQLEHRNTSCPSVSMSDCIVGSRSERSVMRDAEVPVFAFMEDSGRHDIRFVLRWPGYSTLDWARSIPIYVGGRLMSRAQLAHYIASEFKEFVTACDHGVFQTTEPQWRVGYDGITFDRMKLSSLWNPEDNIWVASVRVVGSN
ncbi:hypothetical protein BS17DRAFT_883170 [Gyrodon lividus]|nr:hypothetical protein BS17DRAFT_883170 [Gyrodon lividus]